MPDQETLPTVLVEHSVSLPSRHAIVPVRVLDADEEAEIHCAVRLISRIALSAALRGLQELTEQTLQTISTVSSRAQPSEPEIRNCKQAVRSLVHAHGKWINDTESLISDADTAQASRDAVKELGRSPSWKALDRMAAGEVELVRNRSDIVGVVGTHEDFRSLAEAVSRAYRESEHVYTLTLVACQSDVLAAARRLRSLHCECAGGWPALMESPETAEDARPEQTAETALPQDLPLQLIEEAVRLTHVAQHVLAGGEPPDEPTPPKPSQPSCGSPPAADPTPSNQSSAGDPPPQNVVDLVGLLHLAETLNDDLERAWSGALERAQQQSGVAKQMAAVRAAANGLASHTRGDRVPVGGPDENVLREWEQSPQAPAELVSVAQLSAIASALTATTSLSKPGVVELNFSKDGAEELNRFWKSGAFAQLRDRLALVRHLLRERQEPGRAPLSDVLRHVTLAGQAWHHGDPEGCIFHAACALTALHGCAIEDLETRLVEEPAGAAGIRALRRTLAGEGVLAIAAITAPDLANLASEALRPDDEQPISAGELFEMVSEEFPYIPLDDD